MLVRGKNTLEANITLDKLPTGYVQTSQILTTVHKFKLELDERAIELRKTSQPCWLCYLCNIAYWGNVIVPKSTTLLSKCLHS